MSTRRPETCVGAVVVDAGRLLLIRRGTPPQAGRWAVPGGRLEWGETMAEAVARELHEETGLRADVGELIGWVERFDGDHHFVIFDFAATPRAMEPSSFLAAGDDADDVRWVPLGEVASFDLVPGLAAFLCEHGIIPPTADAADV